MSMIAFKPSRATATPAPRPTGLTAAPDCVTAGAGPLVVLAHCSMAGASQWSRLSTELAGGFRVKAVNLFGYGGTPALSKPQAATLDAFASLLAAAVPRDAENVHLLGHSLGGAVAMHAAAHQLRGRVGRLVLIEPSLFALLAQRGRREAYCEIATLLGYVKACVREGLLNAAAETFIDYWQGAGSWAATPPERRIAFARMARLLPGEAHALLHTQADIARLVAALPRETLLIASRDTTRPSAEIVAQLGQMRPEWRAATVPEGGHMATLTHSRLVNPLVRAFLDEAGDR
jgi:pimeloyl-ACP methyl ester carboxylesterase